MHCQILRTVLEGLEAFSDILECFWGVLRFFHEYMSKVFECCEVFWVVLECSEASMCVLKHYEASMCVLKYYEGFQTILRCSLKYWPFWDILRFSQGVWVVLKGFWTLLSHSRTFQDFFGTFWVVLINFEWFWKAPEGFELLPDVLACSETLLGVLRFSELFWKVTDGSEVLWEVVWCSEALLWVLKCS